MGGGAKNWAVGCRWGEKMGGEGGGWCKWLVNGGGWW